MATYAPPTPTSSGYSFVSYPADYPFSPGNHGASPHTMASVPAIPHMDISAIQHSGHYPHAPHPHYATYAHLQPVGQGPPSPIVSHAHLPPSPVAHPSTVQTPPSPDRSSSSTDTKVMRHVLTAINKMQSTMKDLAERQEQILDRMSLLEQRVGRMDDGIGRILENTEIALEDSKSIRTRVEDNESQDAFETRLTDLMDGVVEKLISGIGEEIKDIKKSVKDTEKHVKFDPFAWSNKMAMVQRMNDANILGEEPQQAIGDL